MITKITAIGIQEIGTTRVVPIEKALPLLRATRESLVSGGTKSGVLRMEYTITSEILPFPWHTSQGSLTVGCTTIDAKEVAGLCRSLL